MLAVASTHSITSFLVENTCLRLFRTNRTIPPYHLCEWSVACKSFILGATASWRGRQQSVAQVSSDQPFLAKEQPPCGRVAFPNEWSTIGGAQGSQGLSCSIKFRMLSEEQLSRLSEPNQHRKRRPEGWHNFVAYLGAYLMRIYRSCHLPTSRRTVANTCGSGDLHRRQNRYSIEILTSVSCTGTSTSDLFGKLAAEP